MTIPADRGSRLVFLRCSHRAIVAARCSSFSVTFLGLNNLALAS